MKFTLLKKNIKIRRVDLGFSRQILADKVGVSKATLMDWEKNPPDEVNLNKLARVLGCTKDWLLNYQGPAGEASIQAKIEQKEKFYNVSEAQKELNEAFAEYHEWLDLILTKGTDEQKMLALGILAVESNKIKKKIQEEDQKKTYNVQNLTP